MGKVTALGECHTHNSVTGLEHGKIYGSIGLCTRMGLYVGKFRSKEFTRSFDCDTFDNVNILTAAVISFSGIALGIFVGHDGTHGFHHLVTYEILRGNEFNAFGLTFSLLLDEVENLSISLHIKYMY